MLDLGQIYDNLDKMAELKRYKPPTPHYFPSVGEINSYAKSKDFPHMLPYLLWLDESLTDDEDRKIHKEAIARLRDIVSEMDDEDEEYGGIGYSEIPEDIDVDVDDEWDDK
jgi:hypothetical protein